MKKLSPTLKFFVLFVVWLCTTYSASAQCTFGGTNFQTVDASTLTFQQGYNTSPGYSVSGTGNGSYFGGYYMSLTNVKAGEAFTVFCGGAYDTQITVFYDASGEVIAYDDDNGPWNSSTPASLSFIAPYSGTYRILHSTYPCTTNSTADGMYIAKCWPWGGGTGGVTPPCSAAFNVTSVGSGTYSFLNLTPGTNYTVSTCGSAFNTHLTMYNYDGANWRPFAYDRQNGSDCNSTNTGSVTFEAPATNGANNYIAVLNRNQNLGIKPTTGATNTWNGTLGLWDDYDASGTSAVLKYRSNGNSTLSATNAAVCTGGTASTTLSLSGSCVSNTLTTGMFDQFNTINTAFNGYGGRWTYSGSGTAQTDGSGQMFITGTNNAWNNGFWTSSTVTRTEGLTYYGRWYNASGMHAMVGWHDNSAGASYANLTYALYHNAGTSLYIYEDGYQREDVSAKASGIIGINKWIEYKIVLHNQGASYYIRNWNGTTGGGTGAWTLVYYSMYSTAATLKPGGATLNDVGTFYVDDIFCGGLAQYPATTGLAAGSYSYMGQDAFGNVSAATATITGVATPTGGSIATVNYCASAGSAAVNITGVSNATQYVWALPGGLTGSSTTSSITVSGATAGSYTVTATPQDVASGITCTGSPVTGTVNIVTTPSGGSIATVNYCASAGSAAVNITGVTGATQYAWALPGSLTGSSTTSSITVSGSTAGSYTVTATPQTVGSGITCNGTPVTGTVNVVTTPTGGSIATVSYCSGAGSAAVSITGATGATQYAWALPGALTGSSTTASITVSGSTAGTYTVTATPQTVGSGITCSGTPVTGTVNVVATPSGGSITTVNYCSVAGSASVNVTGVSNATTYTWALPAALTGSSTTASITVTGATPGGYTVTVTPKDISAGITCTGTPITGTVNIVATPSGGSIPTINYCASAGSAAVNVNGVSGATQYLWALPGALTGTSTTNSITVSGTTPGSYTVTVTPQDVASGITCSGTPVTGTVNVVTTPSGGSIATVNYCSSAGSATVNITGATGATQYAWALPVGLTGSSTTATITVSGTGAGSYTVTATPQTVGSGITCSGTPVTGTVNIVTTPSGGTISTVTYCASTGSASVNVTGVTGATQYAWSLPAGLTGSSTTSSITVTGSTPNTYTVTATPQTVGSGITCAGTPITGSVVVKAIPTATAGATSSATACTSAGSYIIPSGYTATNGTISWTSSGDGTFTSGATTTTPTYTFGSTDIASGGVKTLTMHVANSPCTDATTTFALTITTTPTPTFTTIPANPSCNYSNVTYTTQSGKSNYVWSGFGTAGVDYNIVSGGLSSTDNTVTLQWIGTGTKPVSVSYSVGSCAAVTPATNSTVINASPTPTISTSGAFCTSNSIVYSTQAGQTSYAWTVSGISGTDYTPISGGTSTSSSYTIQWITTGSKTVTVNYNNAAGCPGPIAGTNTGTVTIAPSSATIADVIDGCNGGHTATVTITGGTSPYSFTLCGTAYTNKPSPFELDATSNTSCSLSLVSDANGCAPGTINGSPVTYPARVLTTGDTYACTIATGATKIYYDNSGNLMAKITDGGSTLGSTTVVASIDGTVQKFGPNNPQSYLQRHFKISPTNTSGSANVCLYLSDAEVAALNTSSAGDNHSAPSYYPTFQTNLSNAVVTKFHGAGETPVSNTSRQVIVPTNANKTHNPVVNGVTYNNVWEMCFTVTSWSGFYVHGQNVNNTPLPVSLLYLTADAIDNKYIQLDWATATEINNKEFEIERSTDGADFKQIGTVDGHGNSNSTITYSFDDKTVQPGTVYYYRLKQVDIDGHFVYTEIVSSSLIGDKGFVFEDLIPNPAVSSVQLGILSTTGQKTNVTITDMLGRVVLDTPWQLSEGYNISTFDVSGLAGGTYNVTVYAGTTYTTKRLVVTK